MCRRRTVRGTVREDLKRLPAVLRLKGVKTATTCTELVEFKSSRRHKIKSLSDEWSVSFVGDTD